MIALVASVVLFVGITCWCRRRARRFLRVILRMGRSMIPKQQHQQVGKALARESNKGGHSGRGDDSIETKHAKCRGSSAQTREARRRQRAAECREEEEDLTLLRAVLARDWAAAEQRRAEDVLRRQEEEDATTAMLSHEALAAAASAAASAASAVDLETERKLASDVCLLYTSPSPRDS